MNLWSGVRTRGPRDSPTSSSSSSSSAPSTTALGGGSTKRSSSSSSSSSSFALRTGRNQRHGDDEHAATPPAVCQGFRSSSSSRSSSCLRQAAPSPSSLRPCSPPPSAGQVRSQQLHPSHRSASSSSTSTSTNGNAAANLPLPPSGAMSLARSGDRSDATDPALPRLSARITVTYEEQDEPVRMVPATGSKTLRINMDLMLWRSRSERIAAAMCLDKEQRRQLVRSSEETLRRCIALDPSDPRSYVVLGKTLLQQKRFDEARKLYAAGTAATANNNPYIWASWGWLEFKTGNLDAARKLFDAAVVVDETHACAWHKWGMLERSEGNFLRARDLWMQGIQKCRRKPQSQSAYLYNALAVMASQVGRVEEARAWFEEGTRSLEGAASVALWQAWAVLEAKQGDPTAVRYLFKRALGVNAKSRYVHLAWAMWERLQGNTELCVQLLQRGQALNPTDPAIYQAWAILEKDRGNFAKAAALFEAGLKADPQHIYLWQGWGCMEADRGNHERARELFQEGVWADPNSRNTLYIFHAWGVLEKRLGNIGLARELFKAAIKVDPRSEDVWSTWISMEQELGFLDRADELRMKQGEQIWEFEVPYNFTTRPSESPLAGLVDTLTKFFSAREQGQTKRHQGGKRTLRELLPEDFDDTLSAQDVIPSLNPLQPRKQSFEDALMEQQQQQGQRLVLEQRSLRRQQQGQAQGQARGRAAARGAGAAAAAADSDGEEEEDAELGAALWSREGKQPQQQLQQQQVPAVPLLLERPLQRPQRMARPKRPLSPPPPLPQAPPPGAQQGASTPAAGPPPPPPPPAGA